jgi:hypothetical protein
MRRDNIVPHTIGSAENIHHHEQLLANDSPTMHQNNHIMSDHSLHLGRKNILMRRIFSLFFYCLSGFLIYGICLISFIYIPDIGATKFFILGLALLPTSACIYLGATVDNFRRWKINMGIVLLSGVTVNLLVVIAIICLQLSSKADELFPQHNLSIFTDYLSGITTMLVFASIGSFCFLSGERERSKYRY